MTPPISPTSGFPKCIKPKITEDKTRATPLFFETNDRNCRKYPRKKYSSKLDCIGIRTTAMSRSIKNGIQLNCRVKSSGRNQLITPIATRLKPAHNEKENKIRFQSTLGRAVVSVFIE